MNIKRGQVWNVNLNPTRGEEFNKERPCVVVGNDDRVHCPCVSLFL